MLRASSVLASISIVMATAACASPAPPSTEGPQRGVCYAHAWRGGGDAGYGSAASAETLARLRGIGVDWLSLTPFGFLPSLDATEVSRATFAGGESDERLATETRRAHALGMKIALKPHLWVRRGEWQGALRFADDAAFARFMASYREFILHYAHLAAREKMDLLVVGTELKTATARGEAAWRALIAEVRRAFPGRLTYAANWDEAEHVPFWDALDLVGVQAYAPIATRRGAKEAELLAGWQAVAEKLAALAQRTGRRVLLTEMGYRADEDAAVAPATWPEEGHARPDPALQAACYRAAFSTIWGKPWLAGVHVWKWFTDSRDEHGPTDFSPAGKEAEQVLKKWFGK